MKIILTLILLLMLTTLVGCAQETLETKTLEENIYSGSCPKGLINDPYPGECGQYIDKNNDNICDRSQ
jgi:hypothetical protein